MGKRIANPLFKRVIASVPLKNYSKVAGESNVLLIKK